MIVFGKLGTGIQVRRSDWQDCSHWIGFEIVTLEVVPLLTSGFAAILSSQHQVEAPETSGHVSF
jgi:hypothetical protein